MAAGFSIVTGQATVSGSGNPPAPPPHGPMVPLLVAAQSDIRRQQALAIIGKQHPTWSELYVAFEIVQSDVGGSMFDSGWITKADANLFTQNANNHD